MIEGFLNPGLAIGAALAAVPLAIHLLNRQRHRPERWAAMRFVLAAYRKTRRRVQLENLLLLLLRMLAVAALAFAVARPFASGDSPLAGLQEERRDLVLVIDGSASTGYREDLESVFERILGRAGELMDDLDERRGDRVRVLFAGATPRVWPLTSPTDARSILQTLNQPLAESLDLASAIGELATLLADDLRGGATSGLEVRLLTDLQAGSFRTITLAQDEDGAESQSPPALVEQLERLAALDVRVIVEDHGPRSLRPDNLGVEAIEVLGEGPRAGAPFEVAVAVANHGEKEVLGERIVLSVGGERLPSQRIDVPGRGGAEAVFTVQIDEPGYHALTASLEGDRLVADDARSLVVLAPPPVEVLVVNGAPADRIEDDEIGYLLAVLEPPDDDLGAAAAPFAVRDVSMAALEAQDSGIESADVIILANAPNVPRAVVARLEARVEAGAGLIVTMGDRAGDLARWGEDLFREDGTGLLPAEPLRTVSAARRSSYYRVLEFDGTHPALAFFEDERWRPLLTEAPVYDFVAVRPVSTARVLAQLDDTARSPLLVQRPFGNGSVTLWTTSIDHAWNRIPDSPGTFVPLVLELVRSVGARALDVRNVAVNDSVGLVLDAFPRSANLVSPTGSTRPIEGDATERSDGRWDLPTIDGAELDAAGVYEVRIEGARAEPIAVQLDAAEGDLARATALEIESIHPALVVAGLDEAGDAPGLEAATAGSGELWRWLAIAALAFLVGESLWGALIGRRRRTLR